MLKTKKMKIETGASYTFSLQHYYFTVASYFNHPYTLIFFPIRVKYSVVKMCQSITKIIFYNYVGKYTYHVINSNTL